MAQRVRTDWVLFGTILALAAGGMIVLWSAASVLGESRHGSSLFFGLRQLQWAVVSLGLMMLLKTIDYRRLNHPIFVFPAVSLILGLLAVVYLLDSSHRWIRLGPLNLQPSEFAKPVLILFVAYLVSRRGAAINDRKYTLLPAAAIVGLIAGLVVRPDLGTAAVLAVTAISVFLVAGLNWRNVLVAILICLVFGAAEIVRKPYRIGRIFGFFDPTYSVLDTRLAHHLDPEGRLKAYLQRNAPTDNADYHLKQSLIAVGSGGVLGKGPMRSTQKLLYLPEAHTDFIYAVLAEEYGLLGSLLAMTGFLIIFWRGLRIYFRTQDEFGKCLALGVSTLILFQALMNISVVIGLGPTKGIPLPLVSYGGSSLMSTLICLGLLQSVGDHSA